MRVGALPGRLGHCNGVRESLHRPSNVPDADVSS
jgi:hypothetical protein